MSKLFVINLELDSFISQPNDIESTLSYDGEYNLTVRLPVGVMSFKGACVETLRLDILRALRSMAKETVVPDSAISVAAEVLTDVSIYVEQLNSYMEEQTDTSEDDLATFWKRTFPSETSSKLKQPDHQTIETPFGTVRLMPFHDVSGTGVLEVLQQILGSSVDEDSQPTPKKYS